MPTFPIQAYSKQYSVPSSPYKVSSKSTNRFKKLHLRQSLNVSHLGIVEATVLNIWNRGHLQCITSIQDFIEIH
jgi:hypothetical protein